MSIPVYLVKQRLVKQKENDSSLIHFVNAIENLPVHMVLVSKERFAHVALSNVGAKINRRPLRLSIFILPYSLLGGREVGHIRANPLPMFIALCLASVKLRIHNCNTCTYNMTEFINYVFYVTPFFSKYKLITQTHHAYEE